MSRYNFSKGFLNKCAINYKYNFTCTRTYSKKSTSKEVRQTFLDYFINENNHSFVRSSPVMPFCDPTLAFVNAGMNQFKNIFLGQESATYKRAANSQKCVRVGGKHNDINAVGSDGYHHTFFEMLGNWSFDDYFKKEACKMAWNLLTERYGLNPASLYVTYFSGDPSMNLEPDLECKDIWKEIGIAEDHILPFGSSENFWELGLTGPCGPCTEIHIDHTASKNRSKDVNKGLPDLTELWNIVFIQYNRNKDGSISLLPKRHIDTGMGLERLTAVLQGKISNYDTDIFSNLFERIQKTCKGLPRYSGQFGSNDINNIDTSYRIVADHSRMITACLADGIIPEQNQKLRKIMRRAMLISETVFQQKDGLLNELAHVVVENLGDVYPEMKNNLRQVQQIISYEEEVYKSIRASAMKDWTKIIQKEPRLKNLNILEMPGLVMAYNEIKTLNTLLVSPEFTFKLYDTYGLDENTINSLLECLNMIYEPNGLKEQLDLAKRRSKSVSLTDVNKFEKIIEVLKKRGLKETEDHYKYSYNSKNGLYEFEDLDVNVLYIITNGNVVNEIEANTECYLILNRTQLYSEAGGQISDEGLIKFQNKIFLITDTLNINGCILHKGILKSGTKLTSGETGVLSLNKDLRLNIMANHTATHLLNAALKQVVDGVTCQKSSKVTPNLLNFVVGIYSKKLSIQDIENVENLIRGVIQKAVDVNVKVVNSRELLDMNNVTLVPGEIYPEKGIRLIEVQSGDFFSREPCCGTHVLNTSDIEDICITNFQSLGRSTMTISAVTRDRAILAHQTGEKIYNAVLDIQKQLKNSTKELDSLNSTVNEMRHKLNSSTEDKFVMPVHVKSKCLELLNQLSKELRSTERDSLRQFVDLEMKTIIEENPCKSENNIPYIVHFLGCSSILDNVPLQRATNVCADIPVIVISYSDDKVKARCCVPKNLASPNFSAKLWLDNVSQVFKSTSVMQKEQDGKFICNMKSRHIHKVDWESLLEDALNSAKQYANKHL